MDEIKLIIATTRRAIKKKELLRISLFSSVKATFVEQFINLHKSWTQNFILFYRDLLFLKELADLYVFYHLSRAGWNLAFIDRFANIKA